MMKRIFIGFIILFLSFSIFPFVDKDVFAQDYDTGPLSYPTAAYNPKTNEYLVIGFTGDANAYPDSPGKIVGQRYQGTTPLGQRIILTNDIDSKNMPFVVYNSKKNEFFFAFMRKVNDWDIRAIRLNEKGQKISEEIIVTNAFDQQWVPKVAYNADRDEYLITWHDMRNRDTPYQKDIYGQFVAGDGRLIGQNFLVSQDENGNPAPNTQQYSGVVYNPKAKQFLVVWGDKRNEKPSPSEEIFDIYGAFISAETHQVIGQPKNFLINEVKKERNFAEKNEYPKVAYNLISDEFLIFWQQTTANPEIVDASRPGRAKRVLLRKISGGGKLFPETIVDEELGSWQQQYALPKPDIACNQESGVCLLGWRDQEIDIGVKGRFYFNQGTLGQTFSLGNAKNNPQISLTSASKRGEFLEVLGHNSFGIFSFPEPSAPSPVSSSPAPPVYTPTPPILKISLFSGWNRLFPEVFTSFSLEEKFKQCDFLSFRIDNCWQPHLFLEFESFKNNASNFYLRCR